LGKGVCILKSRSGFLFSILFANVFICFIVYSFAHSSNSGFANAISTQDEPNELLLSLELNDTIDAVDNYQKIGDWNEEMGLAAAVYIQDDIAFVGSSYKNNLVILNVSYPSSPTLISTLFHFHGSIGGIHTFDNYTVLAYKYEGKESALIDTSNLTNPFVVSRFSEMYSVTAVEIVGNIVYLLDMHYGLHIYNISKPLTPLLLNTYDFGHEMYGLDIVGDCAFVSDKSAGLRILNISNPALPILLGSSSMGMKFISVMGSYLYSVRDFIGLRVFDVSNKSNPISVSSRTVNSGLMLVTAKNNFAYVQTFSDGLLIFDVSNPLNPQLRSTCYGLDIAYGILVTSDFAYVCTVSNGLEIVSLANSYNPYIIGEFDFGTFSETENVVLQDDIAFIANSNDGLEILNISDPSNPIKISEYDDGEEILDVTLKDNYAILASHYEGLKILNLSDLSNPMRVAWNDGSGLLRSVYTDEDYIYAVNTFAGTEIYSISDILNPIKEVTISNNGYGAYHVIIRNNLLFIAGGGNGLQIYNIGDPLSPLFVGNYSRYFVTDVVVNDDFAYLACRTEGLVILDITDPSDPFMYTNISLPGISHAIHKDNNFVYIAVDNLGDADSPCMYTFNISCPQQPQLIGKYIDGDKAKDVITNNNYVFLAAWDRGLKILDLDSIEIPPPNTCPPPPTRPVPTNPSSSTSEIFGFSRMLVLTTIVTISIYLIRKKIKWKRKNS
jgi:hypothetical protein